MRILELLEKSPIFLSAIQLKYNYQKFSENVNGGFYMKLFKQFLYLISFTFLGEIISKTLHLPVPGSVMGMLLLFGALYFKLIKVESLETVSTFLLDNLSILFLPAGVGIMVYYSVIQDSWWSLLLLAIVGTLLTMVVVGRVVQFVQRRYERTDSQIELKEAEDNVARIDE